MPRLATLAALVLPLALATPAAAQRAIDHVCVVADPSGTPLNIRDEPNGRVVGVIANGSWVWAAAIQRSRGKPWVYVHDSDRRGTIGPDLGWVYLDYLNCR